MLRSTPNRKAAFPTRLAIALALLWLPSSAPLASDVDAGDVKPPASTGTQPPEAGASPGTAAKPSGASPQGPGAHRAAQAGRKQGPHPHAGMDPRAERATRARAAWRAQMLRRREAKLKQEGEWNAYVAKYDKDGDGKINSQELADATTEREAARAARQRQEALDRYDVNGDGTLDEDEQRTARHENGILTREEVDALLAEEGE